MMLIAEWGLFLFGLLSLLVYYGVFHPSLKDQNDAGSCRIISSLPIELRPPEELVPGQEKENGQNVTQQYESNVWILFDTEVGGILYHFLSSKGLLNFFVLMIRWRTETNQLSAYILMIPQEQN